MLATRIKQLFSKYSYLELIYNVSWVLTILYLVSFVLRSPWCLDVWVERRADPSPLQPPSDEGIEGTQWRKMSTFRNFFTFFNGIHPQMKHLKLKNLCESVSEQAPIECCKIYWGEWDLCQCRSLRDEFKFEWSFVWNSGSIWVNSKIFFVFTYPWKHANTTP